eukprot:TRINITY_DN25005_c0_g1_i1.p1 TRINITY_DN25005_c0_g1~~TRINITY_DN25005_c0_g1_i1.p1  ORF type:complete len:1270 (+),score=180.47 TRINITY_DN25005_c0_g1_i1:65-3874(+)
MGSSREVAKAVGRSRLREERPHDEEAKEARSMAQKAVATHIDSFNVFVTDGLPQIVKSIQPVSVQFNEDKHADDETISVTLTALHMSKPINAYHGAEQREMMKDKRSRRLPAHCRLGHITYAGTLRGSFCVRIGTDPNPRIFEADLGMPPVMVGSKLCNLDRMGSQELVKHKEDENEAGGYFILNGLERVIRMLLMPRSNFPMAITRNSYKKRGKLYTAHATSMRCMRPDSSTQTNTLHYCLDGSVFLRFAHSKEEWLIPLVLVAKAMCDVSDGILLELLAGSSGGSVYLQERALVLLQQQNARQPIGSQSHARRLLGSILRPATGDLQQRSWNDEQVGEMITHKFFMVHCDDSWEKLQTLIIMYQKLISLVRGEIEPDNQDAFSSQELLLPGQLYGVVLKESLEVMMLRIRGLFAKFVRKNDKGNRKHSLTDFKSVALLQKTVETCADIGKKMTHFLSTGNITSRGGLDLMQISGYTIVADKLNTARYSSHFVSVHRGQYFAEMKTTTVRKLLPETWGFLCPVHTPDGAPCGLLNHLTTGCTAVVRFPGEQEVTSIIFALTTLGAEIRCSGGTKAGLNDLLPNFAAGAGVTRAWICLDGKPVGHIGFDRLEVAARELRKLKAAGEKGVPANLEIVCIARSWKHLFPGLFLFLGPSRVVRPVRSLRTGKVEYIGPLEQLFLSVAVLTSERQLAEEQLKAGLKEEDELLEYLPPKYTHEEVTPNEVFSALAALTPFSNHNQSPRNMYQCQMLKQTMGTPYHNHAYRTDNKVYKIHCPQKPIVRTQAYTMTDWDTHPHGTNAVIAVITYTGYDMEDAMIINKGSYDRGFGHGMVYKTKILDASAKNTPMQVREKCFFSNVKIQHGKVVGRYCTDMDDSGEYKLEDDGFPRIGRKLEQGDPLCCIVNHVGKPSIEKYKDEEAAYIESITRICDSCDQGPKAAGQRVSLKLRMTRKPVVGDKFSSRHGQKGVMSILFPAEDMPFSDSGITPDILFNPHGFPSRMTIGMLIESIAAKAAAAEGRSTANASTFREYRGRYCENDNEDDPFLKGSGEHDDREAPPEPRAAEYFGHTLVKHGFQRLGTERMYSGIHGTEMDTEIFQGVVYYQRLRHMVAEKAQVRARGPIDRVTMQPVKGRKRHGGIRFGEMERDSLLAHGTSFLLHDRLMRCSDYDIGFVCPQCGSILTPQANATFRATGRLRRVGEPWECPPCSAKSNRPVRCLPHPLPWVYRYLSVEMASMNVKMNLRLVDRGREASMSTNPKRNNADKTKLSA